jgi:hypothetical protein
MISPLQAERISEQDQSQLRKFLGYHCHLRLCFPVLYHYVRSQESEGLAVYKSIKLLFSSRCPMKIISTGIVYKAFQGLDPALASKFQQSCPTRD